jgi:hypothetical protein
MKKYLIACAWLWSICACADGQSSRQITVEGVDVRVELDESAFQVGAQPIMSWIGRSLGIVAAYYGRFPTDTLRIRVNAVGGEGVLTGKTFGYHGGVIRVDVGRNVTAAQLLNDWVLVHEMTHLALPDVGEDHAWLSEGLAVYVEGIARVQAGNRTQEDVFAEELRSMPRGLPQSGDRGLDNTHNWGRTYWGGAMFCLLADVQIHQRTDNRLGLQDAMRAVARASGGLSTDWPINRVFATADAATGTTVLAELYARMKDAPVDPDLPALWRQLGVVREGASVRLSDDAPLAPVRRAIMQPRVNKTSS